MFWKHTNSLQTQDSNQTLIEDLPEARKFSIFNLRKAQLKNHFKTHLIQSTIAMHSLSVDLNQLKQHLIYFELTESNQNKRRKNAILIATSIC